MSLTVTQRPQVNIDDEVSKWNAVGNPIVYKFQRKDLEFNTISDSGGKVSLQFTGVDVTTDIEAGDKVYLQSDNGEYDIITEVTSSVFSTNTTVVLTADYTGAATTGFVNNFTKKQNYKILVNAYTTLQGTSLTDATLVNESPIAYQPDSKGVAIINVSPVLRVILSPDNLIVNLGPATDFDAHIKFHIHYAETWSGVSVPSYTSDSANVFYAVLASRQIPSEYGGNLAEYVMYPDAAPKGKFLTRLNELSIWKGWPSSISWLAEDLFEVDGGTGLYLCALFDGADFLPSSTLLGATTNGNNNNVMMYDNLKEAYESGNFGDLEKIYCALIVDDLPRNVNDLISEILPVKVKEPCHNPIMLQARNSLGGILEWLFSYGQELSYQYEDGKRRRLTLFAENLTIDEWYALHDFFTTSDITKDNILEFTSDTIKTHSRADQQVYAINSSGDKIGVIVIPTVNTTNTRMLRHRFEITIDYPDNFSV